jgi:hypothetical protein
MDSGLVNLGICVAVGADLGGRCVRLRERYLLKVPLQKPISTHPRCDLEG